MNLTQDEALGFLNPLKGALVFANVTVNFAPVDDPAIGVVRCNSAATLVSCDATGAVLTWSNGRLVVRFDGASFRFPDPEQTGLVGMEIRLAEGVRCVIAPAR